MQGLQLLKKFVSEDEQVELIQWIDSQYWSEELIRRVQHYGYKYDYKNKSVNPNDYLGELPDILNSLAEKICPNYFDQAIINEYLPGQGIFHHVDCKPCFLDKIATITLLQCFPFEMRSIETKEKIVLYPEPGDLLIIEGEARYQWTHGIAKKSSDTIDGIVVPRVRRISITLRKIYPLVDPIIVEEKLILG